MLRLVVRGGAVLLGVVFVLALTANPADAHADLLRSDPASGVTLPEPPSLVQLWFSEEISGRVSTARLVRGDGSAVPGTTVVIPTADPTRLQLELPQLPAGTYGVLWQVLATDDGHTTSGTLVFNVGTASGASVLSAGTSDSAQGVSVALRWARVCLLVGLVGALAVVTAVLGPVGRRQPHGPLASALGSARSRLLSLAAACAGAGVAVGLMDQVEQVRRLGMAGISWSATAGELLLGTRWGQLWIAREALLVALVPILLGLRSRAERADRGVAPKAASVAATVPMVAAVAATLGLVWVEALGSHAAAVPSDRSSAVAADALHILAACLWLGALPALLLMLWPHGARAASGTALVRACSAPMARLIAASVGVVVVTGLYGAGRQVGSVDELLSTPYGRILLVKTALLALLLSVGLLSATRLHGIRLKRSQARADDHGRPLTRRLVTVEVTVGALLLVAVGFLAETAPARGQARTGAVAQLASRSGHVADVVVSVSAAPNSPGPNGFTVVAASTRRPAIAAIDTVQLEISRGGEQTLVALQATGPDRYFGTARLDSPGTFRIDVVVLRGGARLVVPLSWDVSRSTPRLAVATSGRALAPFVNGLALFLVIVVGVAGTVYGMRRRSQRPQAPVDDEVLVRY